MRRRCARASLLLAFVGCGGDPAGPSGAAGGGGTGELTVATADVAAPVAVSASSSSSGIATAVGVGGTGGTGSGGSGGQGGDGGAGAACTDAWLPGAGGADGSRGSWPPRCEAGAPCYGGPPGSDGVGTCRAGEQVCAEDETVAACEGEITPLPEDCSSTETEACTQRTLCGPGIVFPIARAGDVVFGSIDRRLGTVDRDLQFTPIGDAVDTDLIGTDPLGSAYAYTASRAAASVDLVRMTRDGAVLYARPVFNPPPLHALGDENGNVVLLHHPLSTGELTLDEPVTGEGEAALHRLSPSGTHRWSRRYGVIVSGLDFQFGALAVEPGGDIAVSGFYDGEVELGPETLPEGRHGFLSRIDGATGDVEWVTVLPEGEGGVGQIIFTPDGSIVGLGGVQDPETFDQSGVIAMFDGDGDVLWRREIRSDAPHRVSLSSPALTEEQDAIVFSGSVTGAVSLDGLPAGRDAPHIDPLLGSIDLEGNALSLRSFETRGVGKRLQGRADAYAVLPMCGRVLMSGLIRSGVGLAVGPIELQNVTTEHVRYAVELPLER